MANLTLAHLIAQGAGEQKSFEVASVKLSIRGPVRVAGSGTVLPKAITDPGRVEYPFTTLKTLIMRAYSVADQQVVCPEWMSTTRYDLAATLPRGTEATEVPPMLQTLLAERFHLAAHKEIRIVPKWELVLDKNGPKLKPSDGDREVRLVVVPIGTTIRMVGDISMRSLAERLSALLNLLVIDRTELSGVFRIDMNFDVPQTDSRIASADSSSEPSHRSSADLIGELSNALRKTLGLKLEMVKGPLEVLVIDHADKVPTPE